MGWLSPASMKNGATSTSRASLSSLRHSVPRDRSLKDWLRFALAIFLPANAAISAGSRTRRHVSRVSAQELKEPLARQEEVSAAQCRDEAFQRFEPHRSIAGWNHKSGAAFVVAADNRILLARQPMERRAVEPGLLNEFELAFDASVQAHE